MLTLATGFAPGLPGAIIQYMVTLTDSTGTLHRISEMGKKKYILKIPGGVYWESI